MNATRSRLRIWHLLLIVFVSAVILALRRFALHFWMLLALIPLLVLVLARKWVFRPIEASFDWAEAKKGWPRTLSMMASTLFGTLWLVFVLVLLFASTSVLLVPGFP